VPSFKERNTNAAKIFGVALLFLSLLPIPIIALLEVSKQNETNFLKVSSA